MIADSIIFDLDGTLWDSSKEVTKAWNTILEKENKNFRVTVEGLMDCMGMLMEDIADVLFVKEPVETRYELLSRCMVYENEYIGIHGGKLYPNTESTIKDLKLPLCIVSNCQAGYIEAFLKAHKLGEYFLDMENPGRTGLNKAGNIKLVVERNNFKNPVYVGDILGDYKSATEAGVPFIHAAYGFGKVDCEHKIEDISQLLDIDRI